MNGLLDNFLGSLLASITILIAMFIFRNRIKRRMQIAFYNLIGLGIEAVYKNLNEFSAELDRLCTSSSNIQVLSFRGAKSCSFLFKNRNMLVDKNVEVIMVNPFSKKGQKWIEQREKEVDKIGYFEMGEREATMSYLDQVKLSVKDLASLGENIKNFHLYLHHSQAIWSLYIFDNKIGYIGGYTMDNLGRSGIYYKLSGNNYLLKLMIRQYEYVRDHCSKEYQKSLASVKN